MFLFDSQRTGRQNCSIDRYARPEAAWEITLPSRPAYAPESTSICDADGNFYFGAHNGLIYCAHPQSGVRWSYYVKKKVYSSPLWIDDDKFAIATGSGELLCFSKSGELLWVYDIGVGYRGGSSAAKCLKLLGHWYFLWDWGMRKLQRLECWSSPNIYEGLIYITGYGHGLHAVNAQSGQASWTFDLGWPRYHRAGVAISSNGEIFAASQHRNVFCLGKDGDVIWSAPAGPVGYEAWSNPSVDEEHGQVYFAWSRGERSSLVAALDMKTGAAKWVRRLPAGIRGTATIGWRESLYVPGLDGLIYRLRRTSGVVEGQRKIACSARGLWTSGTVLKDDTVLITTKDSATSGRLVCLSADLEELWNLPVGKALSVPMFTAEGQIVIGSWHGKLMGIRLVSGEADSKQSSSRQGEAK